MLTKLLRLQLSLCWRQRPRPNRLLLGPLFQPNLFRRRHLPTHPLPLAVRAHVAGPVPGPDRVWLRELLRRCEDNLRGTELQYQLREARHEPERYRWRPD